MVTAVDENETVEKFILILKRKLQARAHERTVEVAHVYVCGGGLYAIRRSQPHREYIGRIEYLFRNIRAHKANYLLALLLPVLHSWVDKIAS
jgi:hypothetical protein